MEGASRGCVVTRNQGVDGLGEFSGRYVKNYKDDPNYEDVNVDISVKLKKENRAFKVEKYEHSYPHCWRTDKPVLYYPLDSWFIKTTAEKEKMVELNKSINWKPEATGTGRFGNWLENLQDWNLSRSRFWGIPLPIWRTDDSAEEICIGSIEQLITELRKSVAAGLCKKEILENIEKGFEERKKLSSIEKAEKDYSFFDLHKPYIDEVILVSKEGKPMTRESDLIDVWFDSGSTHSYVLDKRPELAWPANLYLEGSDQHRGWFHSSLLESCGTKGTAPFKNILCHGFVVDGKGQKMSKSLGNVVLPEEVIKNFGADILRLWVVASDYSEDLKIDKAILNQHAESYRKIRNTLRFLLGNLSDKLLNDDFSKIEYSKLSSLEKYILTQVYDFDLRFRDYIKSYNFHKIYVELLNFCTLDLSAFYFDIKKDILYCDSEISQRRNHCLEVLNVLINFLLKWFSPILAFTTEEAYQVIKNKNYKSIHLQDFSVIPSIWNNSEIKNKWIGIKKVKQVVNAAIEDIRNKKIIGSNLEANVIVYLKDEYLNLIKGEDLSEIFICSEARAESFINQNDLFSLKDVEGVAVKILKAKGQKCSRCWKILEKPCSRDICGLKN